MTDAARMACILLVDDSAMDVELTINAFSEVQVSSMVEVARSGNAAIARVLDRPVHADGTRCPLPDLILLDLKMPGIDGFEVLRQLKSAPVLRRIPVIILTSSREEGDRAMAYDLGANSYLVKPVSFDGFLGVIRSVHDYWLTLNLRPPLAGMDMGHPA
jgi:CheY-like chemotaxis protein